MCQHYISYIIHNPASKEEKGRKDRERQKSKPWEEGKGKGGRNAQGGRGGDSQTCQHIETGQAQGGRGQSNMPALHVLHNLECQHMSYVMAIAL